MPASILPSLLRPLIFLSLVVLLASPQLRAAPLRVAVAEWTGWMDERGHGYAADIFAGSQAGSGVMAELKHFPLKRAIAEYEKQRVACYLGGSKSYFEQRFAKALIESDAIFEYRYVVYTRKDQPLVTDVAQMQGKRIGIVLGMNISPFIQRGIEAEYDAGKSTAVNVRKLEAGRLDMLIASDPELPELVGKLHFAPDLILHATSDRLHCHPSPETRELIGQFNRGLQSLRASGGFDEILRNYSQTR